MERCPSCRAKIKDNQQCQRCGTELATLFEVEKQAQQAFNASVEWVEQNDLASAMVEAQRAFALHRTELYVYWLQFLRGA
jgi:uncharacterized membrane protein YvbJ